MATARFVQTGNAIDYTPDADVSAGEVIVQNDLVGVAKLDIKADALGALAVTGVFDFPKATGGGTAIAAGVWLFWDEGESVAKEDAEAGANKLIGKAILAAGDDDETVRARLSQ
jgi:predicted RecA/RadA family phage recombinase